MSMQSQPQQNVNYILACSAHWVRAVRYGILAPKMFLLFVRFKWTDKFFTYPECVVTHAAKSPPASGDRIEKLNLLIINASFASENSVRSLIATIRMGACENWNEIACHQNAMMPWCHVAIISGNALDSIWFLTNP